MRGNSFMDISNCRMMMPSSVVQSPSTADLFMSSLTGTTVAAPPRSTSQKKYLVCCLICGSFSCLLGAMFLGVYYLIRTHTLTGYFETVPTYVPASMLIVTGFCIICFAKRKHRYQSMIYFAGVSSAVSAITCAAVTVTTRILHMSRLQDLNLNCEYKITTRICTCYSDYENRQDDGRKFLFDAVADCRVAQGDLYSCLQAIFGLSIAGVLVAVFSCMLSYLLFSHERKKMYWEQLDMRCRLMHASHFSGHHHHHHHQGVTLLPPNHHHNLPMLPSTIITNNSRTAGNGTSCGYCEHCHAQATAAATAAAAADVANAALAAGYPHPQQILTATRYPWGDVSGDSKYLTIGGCGGDGGPVGGYTGLEQHNFGNFYVPNFNSIHHGRLNGGGGGVGGPGIDNIGDSGNMMHGSGINNNPEQNCGSGWRWPRMPWQRNLDFNLFQQAFLSARQPPPPPPSDLQTWNSYLQSSHCMGYPIGMWGPPPPPYTDPNNIEWRGVDYQLNQNEPAPEQSVENNNNNIHDNSISNNNINNINNLINNNNNNSSSNRCQSIPNLEYCEPISSDYNLTAATTLANDSDK